VITSGDFNNVLTSRVPTMATRRKASRRRSAFCRATATAPSSHSKHIRLVRRPQPCFLLSSTNYADFTAGPAIQSFSMLQPTLASVSDACDVTDTEMPSFATDDCDTV